MEQVLHGQTDLDGTGGRSAIRHPGGDRSHPFRHDQGGAGGPADGRARQGGCWKASRLLPVPAHPLLLLRTLGHPVQAVPAHSLRQVLHQGGSLLLLSWLTLINLFYFQMRIPSEHFRNVPLVLISPSLLSSPASSSTPSPSHHAQQAHSSSTGNIMDDQFPKSLIERLLRSESDRKVRLGLWFWGWIFFYHIIWLPFPDSQHCGQCPIFTQAPKIKHEHAGHKRGSRSIFLIGSRRHWTGCGGAAWPGGHVGLLLGGHATLRSTSASEAALQQCHVPEHGGTTESARAQPSISTALQQQHAGEEVSFWSDFKVGKINNNSFSDPASRGASTCSPRAATWPRRRSRRRTCGASRWPCATTARAWSTR